MNGKLLDILKHSSLPGIMTLIVLVALYFHEAGTREYSKEVEHIQKLLDGMSASIESQMQHHNSLDGHPQMMVRMGIIEERLSYMAREMESIREDLNKFLEHRSKQGLVE